MQNYVILDVKSNKFKVSRATLKKAGGKFQNLDSVPSLLRSSFFFIDRYPKHVKLHEENCETM